VTGSARRCSGILRTRKRGSARNPRTWLAVPGNYTTVNVESEMGDPDSLLNWNRRLIGMRRTNPALAGGW